MLEREKVSVVVPIYKVEKYIHRCVDSILNQTYTNLEVILVDDGSPDECGRIADDYKKRDSRVKVLHKTNGGLSDARNAGMKQVTGEFTVFVDSDDWIEPNMIETMVYSSLTHKADVVQTAFYYAYEDKFLFDNRYYSDNDPPVIVDKARVMYELVVNEKVKNFAWGKLYKTELIKGLPFEKGVLFEDVFWAHKVMHQVNIFLLIPQPMYNYYQRNDSIIATYTTRNLDILKGLKERHAYLETFHRDLLDESYKNILKMSLIHYNLLFMNRKKDRQRIYRREIQSYIREYYEPLNKAAKHDKQLARQLQLFMIHPLFNIFFLGTQKVCRKLNLLNKPAGLVEVRKSKEVFS
ncbi:glycosyltransferase family 2 protein [Domibacillus sp. PGB-M46]|uniref:glycosyltransferase family 2 protein n=1 Tax=Domibacillus sp. PGB-M46 TaxID=2910255 RepID=UPI001F5A1A86|nr:glycosyltransferase family 2 protein [Domibacillus sp. PGB-M46]MCI2255201.1 glycosyltransferase family 2 protein [Domibacillus sp. PGB-M46]